MKVKKLLLGFAVVTVTLLNSNFSFAVSAPSNRLGYIPAKTTANIYCSASRFFPGSPPTTLVKDEKQGGLETDFLITNTSSIRSLSITQVAVYGMTGKLITTLSPTSTIDTPAGVPAFKWTLAPFETTRLPHEATLPLMQQSKPELLWSNVVFTVKSKDDSQMILAPMAYSDFVEKATPANGGGVLSRIRADCTYR